MAHVLFGGSNRPGLAALDGALELGHRVTFITTKGIDTFFRDAQARAILSRVKVVEIEDFKDTGRLARYVADIHEADPVDAALTVFEPVVLSFAQACARCGIRTTSAQAIAYARDKSHCRDVLRSHGISQVPSRLVPNAGAAADFAREIGFPMILKPNNGLASMIVRRVDDCEAITSYFEHIEAMNSQLPVAVSENIDLGVSIVAERYVTGTLYSVEVALTVDGPVFFVLSRRKRASHDDTIELGSTMPGTLDAELTGRAFDKVGAILSALGFDRGIFHVELIVGDDGVPHLVEVNPRLMGGTSPSLYNLASGRNVFRDLVQIHLDEPIQPAPELRSAVASRVIGAAQDWVVRSDLPADWIDELAPQMAFHAISLVADQKLPRMTHNFNALGQFQVRAATPVEADAKANALLASITRITGVPLCA